jgi:serine/threonine protein kinase
LLKKSRPSGRLSEEECRILMKKLVSGLRDLYEFDIVHRDLKLANILLHFPNESGLTSEDARIDELIDCIADEKAEARRLQFLSKVDLTKVPFEIKIADFGFSKYLNEAKYDTSGTMCGTPLYMSP